MVNSHLAVQDMERRKMKGKLRYLGEGGPVSYREQLYKSNTSKGGSNMSEQDLSRELEVGDLIVGECRCDPSKKGIVEVVGSSCGVQLRIPEGYRYWGDTPTYFLSDLKNRAWEHTVGGAIGFLTGGGQYTKKLHRDYHNWKHIPKSDFTFEIGDVLYGECACTPSKFVVFEYRGYSYFKVVDCWDKDVIGTEQCCSYDRSHADATHGYNTLNKYAKNVFSVPFREYNYKKYSKDEWQKRQASKFIRPGAVIKKQEPKEHRFKKSDFKVTETDKEIRVTPRPNRLVTVYIDGKITHSFKTHDESIEHIHRDLKRYIVEQ